MAAASSRRVPTRFSCHAVVYPPPTTSGCATYCTGPVEPVAGAGLATYSGGLRIVRVVADSSGWNPHATASSPGLGASDTSSTLRLLWTSAENATLPRVVVTVPDSSAFQRSRLQSTAVTVPAKVSFRYP